MLILIIKSMKCQNPAPGCSVTALMKGSALVLKICVEVSTPCRMPTSSFIFLERSPFTLIFGVTELYISSVIYHRLFLMPYWCSDRRTELCHTTSNAFFASRNVMYNGISRSLACANASVTTRAQFVEDVFSVKSNCRFGCSLSWLAFILSSNSFSSQVQS